MSEEVARLVHAYADAVCNNDATGWASTWADDAVWDMGGLRLQGRADIAGAWAQAMADYEQVIQVVYNGAADLDVAAGVGSGRWYVGEFLKPRDGDPKMLLARYDDRYVSVAGVWLFAERALERLYSGPPDLSGVFGSPPSGAAST